MTIKNYVTIPAEFDEQYGCNVHPGDQIIVTDETGNEIICRATGWRRCYPDDAAIEIKTDVLGSDRFRSFPMESVAIILLPREKELVAVIKELRGVLKWYADSSNYINGYWNSPVESDFGSRADTILETTKEFDNIVMPE